MATSNNDLTGFYQTFYDSFLTTANSLPINSLWVIFVDNIPEIDVSVQDMENWKITNTIKAAQKEAERKKGGIIIAQGVKVIGENNNVVRDGIKNTGYIQGLVSQGREGFPLLNVSFLENNISFTDYFLRPWQVAVSHNSLKDQSLKTNIHIWFLSKMGPKQPLEIRKSITYYNCCPVSINEEEYNYTGSDVYRLRQVQFAFSRYEMEDITPTLLGLIGVNGSKTFFETLGSRLKNELQRQFGQYTIENIVNRAKTFGKDLIAGTATQIVTNVAGKIQDKVEGAITSVESSIRGGATKLVNSVNNVVDNALHNSSTNRSNNLPTTSINQSVAAQVDTQRRIGANKEAFGGYKEKNTNSNDTPIYLKTIDELQRGKPAEVDINKSINQNDYISDSTNIPFKQNSIIANPNDDTVMLNTKLKYNFKKSNPPLNDVRHGDINHEDVIKKINQNDYVSSLQLDQSDKAINDNDIPIRNSIKFTTKSIKQDDTPKYH